MYEIKACHTKNSKKHTKKWKEKQSIEHEKVWIQCVCTFIH